jgi:hypothetical protein
MEAQPSHAVALSIEEVKHRRWFLGAMRVSLRAHRGEKASRDSELIGFSPRR